MATSEDKKRIEQQQLVAANIETSPEALKKLWHSTRSPRVRRKIAQNANISEDLALAIMRSSHYLELFENPVLVVKAGLEMCESRVLNFLYKAYNSPILDLVADGSWKRELRRWADLIHKVILSSKHLSEEALCVVVSECSVTTLKSIDKDIKQVLSANMERGSFFSKHKTILSHPETALENLRKAGYISLGTKIKVLLAYPLASFCYGQGEREKTRLRKALEKIRKDLHLHDLELTELATYLLTCRQAELSNFRAVTDHRLRIKVPFMLVRGGKYTTWAGTLGAVVRKMLDLARGRKDLPSCLSHFDTVLKRMVIAEFEQDLAAVGIGTKAPHPGSTVFIKRTEQSLENFVRDVKKFSLEEIIEGVVYRAMRIDSVYFPAYLEVIKHLSLEGQVICIKAGLLGKSHASDSEIGQYLLGVEEKLGRRFSPGSSDKTVLCFSSAAVRKPILPSQSHVSPTEEHIDF